MIEWKREWWKLLLIVVGVAACFYLPVEWAAQKAQLPGAAVEGLHLVREYAQEHILLCLVPALFIAGGIGVFLSQASVMKYLGAGANKVVAYGVASVSGAILAVCSCTVLPLFAGIHRMGAGLGPATTFLYSGPAINILAIGLTARVLGVEMGIARAVGAIVFSIVIGLLMQLIFRKDSPPAPAEPVAIGEDRPERPLWKTALFLGAMVGVLVFANWAKPESTSGVWYEVWKLKWPVTAGFAAGLAVMAVVWLKLPWLKVAATAAGVGVAAVVLPDAPQVAFVVGALGLSWTTSTNRGEGGEWFASSWGFAKQIVPLLLVGVVVAGAALGRPGQEGLVPSRWIEQSVGGNSLAANFFAAAAAALMYFATLTEVPILQGLMNAGMGKGPALAMLLAGPAVSLPNILVIRSVVGTKKALVFVGLVIVMATATGMIYGMLFGGPSGGM
jgi:uncharacterized protein